MRQPHKCACRTAAPLLCYDAEDVATQHMTAHIVAHTITPEMPQTTTQRPDGILIRACMWLTLCATSAVHHRG